MPTNLEVELFKIEQEKLKVFKQIFEELFEIRRCINDIANNYETFLQQKGYIRD